MFDHFKIPLEEILSSTNSFAKENLIDYSSYGRAYAGVLSHSHGRSTDVIIHRLDHFTDRSELGKIIGVFSIYKHENLVSFVGYCDESGEKILVLNREKHGSLDKLLGSTDLTWIKRIRISVGVARGLNFLHGGVGIQRGLVHRDITSSNILVDENWDPKITGWGYSRMRPANQVTSFVVTNAVGTFGYMDPEYVRIGILTKESDIYSFGVVLFEMLCGISAYGKNGSGPLVSLVRPLYNEGRLDELIDPILRKQMDPVTLGKFSDLAYQCLNGDRTKRPQMALILQELMDVFEFQRLYELQLQVKMQLQGPSGGLKKDVQDDYKVKGLDHLKIPLEEIKSATDDFKRGAIGRGGYGTVFKAELFHYVTKSSESGSTTEIHGFVRTKSTVAIKRLDPNSNQGRAEFLQEISLLCNYRHKNITTLLGFCDEDTENIIVYEYASNRSLDRYLRGKNCTLGRSWTGRLQICIDVAQGIDYLHNGVGDHHRIIHRDMKSANILLDQNWQAKICDFGLSRIGPSNVFATFVMTEVAGTWDYVDPQYFQTRRLTKESDVYSFGVVLFEVLCGRLVRISSSDSNFLPNIAKRCIKENTMYEIIDPTLKNEFKESGLGDGKLPDSVDIFASIAHKCLEGNQQDRPTISEVVEELEKAKKSYVKGVEALRISLDKIKSSTGDFSNGSFIGMGESAKLYKGQLSLSNELKMVAIKRLNRVVGSYSEGEFLEKISLLSSYNHENVIPLLGFCEEAGERIIVYEFALHGSLDKHLHVLTWRQRLKICVGIAHGLDHIHSGLELQNTVHGDIKSAKILLHHDWEATITDFIVSKGAGTLGYLDPHILTTGIITKESDVYSFGVVLFEILSGRMAIVEESNDRRRSLVHFAADCFEEKKLEEIIYDDINKQAEPSTIETFAAIAYQCIRKNREDRPKLAQVTKELENALKVQDEWEWEKKLPIDYPNLIQLSKVPMSNTITRKELHSRLSSGILLQDNVWLSINKEGMKSKMVSSTMFSYESDSTVKWTSLQKSRFPKVAKILDIANLNTQIRVTTKYLTPEKTYGAYLIFRFCEHRKASSQPLYVNLKYKKAGETLNAYFAKWGDGHKWLMIELFRFNNNNQTSDFELLLESFSRYYCGSGGVFVEGIEFRPLAVDPSLNKDIEDKKDVQKILKLESNMHQREFVADDYGEVIKRSQNIIQKGSKEELYTLLSQGILIDNGEKLFSLSNVNMKKCHMLPAKAVIVASPNVKFHNRKPPAQSRCRFTEVVEIRSHFELRIKCNIEIQMLSPDTDYACFLVFQISKKRQGLKSPVKVCDLSNKNKETNIISFRTPRPENLHNIKWIPENREDGWMEVMVSKVNLNKPLIEEYVVMDLKLINFEENLRGLIVCGIEFQPM